MRNAILLLPFAAFSCSDKVSAPENTLVHTDFDTVAGWVPETPSLTREQAHSGMYSIKTDADLEYSLTYRQVLARLSEKPLRKVRLTAWAYVSQPGPTAKISLQLKKSMHDQTDVFNGNIELEQVVKTPRQWTRVSQVFTLPAEVSPAHELRLYLWRGAASGPVYIDDLTLSVEP